jgi:hypothetical protein
MPVSGQAAGTVEIVVCSSLIAAGATTLFRGTRSPAPAAASNCAISPYPAKTVFDEPGIGKNSLIARQPAPPAVPSRGGRRATCRNVPPRQVGNSPPPDERPQLRQSLQLDNPSMPCSPRPPTKNAGRRGRRPRISEGLGTLQQLQRAGRLCRPSPTEARVGLA